MVIAIDYFTKWVEAEPLASITEADIQSFVWINVLCRYGTPQVIVADNGGQFTFKDFQEFCDKYGIDLRSFSVEYP